jgi:hypothetical protein
VHTALLSQKCPFLTGFLFSAGRGDKFGIISEIFYRPEKFFFSLFNIATFLHVLQCNQWLQLKMANLTRRLSFIPLSLKKYLQAFIFLTHTMTMHIMF